MKRYISLAVALLCLGLFFACGWGYVPTPPAEEPVSTTMTETVTEPESETTEPELEPTMATTESAAAQTSAATTASTAPKVATAVAQHTVAATTKVSSTVSSTTRTTTTTTTSTMTTTTAPVTPAAAPPNPPAPVFTQALCDYEIMGQAQYQEEAIKALNAMRAERGLAPMVKSGYLMSTCLDQAQKMAAAEECFHTGEFPPGFEAVSYVPYKYPAKTLGEMLTLHVGNFLGAQSTMVGIAVVRSGNRLYAVMQGN